MVHASEPAASDRGRPAPVELPIEETDQPDPMLALNTGKMGAGRVILAVLVIAVIIGVVLYGMTR